jgi:hypothetical protein
MKRAAGALVPAILLIGCATLPPRPSVMALPGSSKSFDEFQFDDGTCRSWAEQQIGVAPQTATADQAIQSAAIGTGIGAAAGAAIGAASGHPGAGAAVGAGSGLLVGSAVGAGRADAAGHALQERYDAAYVQCMYAKGNQVPVERGSVATPPRVTRRSAAPPPPPSKPYRRIPPPPPGAPPPPPPDL